MKLHIAIITGILMSAFFFMTVKFYKRHDENNKLSINLKIALCYMFFMTLLSFALQSVNIVWEEYICASLLISYMSISAYIDYRQMEIYTSFNLLGLIIGAMCLIYTVSKMQIGYIDIYSLGIWSLVLIISKIFKAFGSGDFEVLIVESIYIIAMPSMGELKGGGMLLIIMMAYVIQFVSHFNEIDFPTLKLKNPVAFIPALFGATVINMFLAKIK